MHVFVYQDQNLLILGKHCVSQTLLQYPVQNKSSSFFFNFGQEIRILFKLTSIIFGVDRPRWHTYWQDAGDFVNIFMANNSDVMSSPAIILNRLQTNNFVAV